jgi:hypothetical protein
VAWLAQVGDEYLQEKADPARLLDRARQAWRQQGRRDEWIAQRMTGQVARDKPTDPMSEMALIFAAQAALWCGPHPHYLGAAQSASIA